MKTNQLVYVYAIAFLVFAAGVFVALKGKNYGSAIWLGIAASNCVSLAIWADLKEKIELKK